MLKKVLRDIKHDCRSTTGNNLRHIMKLVKKSSVDDLEMGDVNNLTYNKIPDGEEWKITLA